MATAKKVQIINSTLIVPGLDSIVENKEMMELAAENANRLAMTALQTNDRKGVLLQMKVAGVYTRTASALQRAIDRSQRVRLTRDEKKAFELNGALPQGYKVVEDVDDDDDDTDTEV